MALTEKMARRLTYLTNLYNHPKTSEGEKAAALNAMERIKANHPKAYAQVTPNVTGYYGDMFIGARYQRGLDVAKIAATLRKEFAAARKAAAKSTPDDDALAILDPIGDLPKEYKISVRISRFSGGQSIDINVSGMARVEGEWFTEVEDYHFNGNVLVPTRRLCALISALEGALNAFNYDGSDTQTDYFNVNFYGGATINGTSYSSSPHPALRDA